MCSRHFQPSDGDFNASDRQPFPYSQVDCVCHTWYINHFQMFFNRVYVIGGIVSGDTNYRLLQAINTQDLCKTLAHILCSVADLQLYGLEHAV